MRPSFYAHNLTQLEEILIQNELAPVGASQLFNWHYRHKNVGLCNRNLAEKTKQFINNYFSFELPVIDTVQEAKDNTVKFLFKFTDNMKAETVLIPFQNKYALCLSTQVGCGMKCSFCFTGKQGLKRNLTPDEIIGQFIGAWNWLKQNRPEAKRILSIVYMGQGEPLHNFDAVLKANEIFLEKKGISLGCQRITVSTSGYLPGLHRFVNEMFGVNIALSLHSPFKHKRDQLIPINKNYPLAEVLNAIDMIPLKKKQFIIYEYLLIKDLNDQVEDALATIELLKVRKGPLQVNLIPFNPFPGSHYERPSLERVEAFYDILKTHGIGVTIRTTKGNDILAACGQLNSATPSFSMSL
ncbi:MAG: 23S rRNA (adenine(2503)-C(2))-methyltransferase RlmN [Bacteriovoracaceae bacterium]